MIKINVGVDTEYTKDKFKPLMSTLSRMGLLSFKDPKALVLCQTAHLYIKEGKIFGLCHFKETRSSELSTEDKSRLKLIAEKLKSFGLIEDFDVESTTDIPTDRTQLDIISIKQAQDIKQIRNIRGEVVEELS